VSQPAGIGFGVAIVNQSSAVAAFEQRSEGDEHDTGGRFPAAGYEGVNPAKSTKEL
jgi:hypothetical protein